MITEEEILEIAVLSKLYVPEEQLEQLTKDMAEFWPLQIQSIPQGLR